MNWIRELWFRLTACPFCKARRDSFYFGAGIVYVDPAKMFKEKP